MPKDRRLVVISIDALTDDDIRRAGDTPNLDSIRERGAYIPNINGIYPSLTHPCHATIITGRTPGVHGIVSNEDFSKPGRPWFNDLSDLKSRSVIDCLKGCGKTVASCRWPVTANGFDRIDYLIPEITSETLIKDDILGYYLDNSSPILKDIIEEHIVMLDLKSQPEEDLFSTACACEILRCFRPDVLFTHPACVDTYKHHTGIRSSKTLEMVRLADRMVGDLIQATRDAGTFESTVFVVLSDHGHNELDREIALNEVFRRDGKGDRLVADECGHSAQIYVNGMAESEAFEYLQSKVGDESGIERVFTKEELRERYGTFGAFSFMVESDAHTQFSNAIGTEIETRLTVDDHHGCSTHGHMPEKSPKPIFMAAGPNIAHRTITEASMLQEAPTFLKVMGIEAPDLETPLDIFRD
ncbi:MAG: alkaline phosphatase family protein [Spirochaetales bacterium]|nr:alkaline phosphatase family protein [Spirochaetales bacterium]